MNKEFASTSWSAEDVHSKRADMGLRKWSNARAEKWLDINQGQILDDMVERGWESMETLMQITEDA